MASKKYTALCIYEILKEHSDQNHPLMQKDIINYLKSNYNIEIERKSIGSIINEMMEDDVFSDFDIQKVNKRGVYLDGRIIQKEEMIYIKDALFSSKSLTGKQAKGIIEKLGKEFSKYERDSFKYVHKTEDINRTTNKSVLYSVDIISEAIEKKAKIKFNYDKNLLNGEKKNKEHIVNPYFLINNQSKYYLVANIDKYDDLSHFRVDQIENIEILDIKAKPINQLPAHKKGIDIAKYVNARPYMFSGDLINAKIKLLKDDSLNPVIDWFGNIKPYSIGSIYYVDLNKINETALIYWCLQYCDYVELVEPFKTRQKIKEKISATFNRYK